MEMEKFKMPETKKPPVPFLAETWYKLTTGPSGGIKKVLSPREYGQLKMLRNGLEDVAVFVMVWVTSNWRVFTQRAVNAKGFRCRQSYGRLRRQSRLIYT